MSVQILVPDNYMGDVMGDINKRRGRVIGMEPEGRAQKIYAEVPMSRNVYLCNRFKINDTSKRKSLQVNF